mmetsp:Transcript_9748/g.30882  ORF Transcript_9748/g.30882 Transcript_9748/m.30882 type:complete len:151 (+) Transcript_9748:144-596(+)|eukprot:CAMPEP_0185309648 /NCGR_PEP_ID=MMETSP1363-20130426/22550_1 /TAXON_ID=38817 /ORGANISM="Gephyrocapsa oceanica, Strain RCC1303" /LENGTH=150 /DNA_ID=CAMNT_0027907157 /DNA_START=139 /DNA_END=591 /DNA_ORIENTATION=-
MKAGVMYILLIVAASPSVICFATSDAFLACEAQLLGGVYQTVNNVIDLDKNGIISKEEFVTSDKDGDGQLTIKEADVDAQLISTSSSTSCKEVDVDDFSVVYRMEGDDVVSSIEFDGAPRLGFLRCCNCVGPVCPMAAINLWMALWPCCE